MSSPAHPNRWEVSSKQLMDIQPFCLNPTERFEAAESQQEQKSARASVLGLHGGAEGFPRLWFSLVFGRIIWKNVRLVQFMLRQSQGFLSPNSGQVLLCLGLLR